MHSISDLLTTLKRSGVQILLDANISEAPIFILFYKFSPNPLIGRIGKDRAPVKQSLLRWPCPLPSDRAIPGL